MKLSALKPDTKNANRGTARGRKLVEQSLRTYGAGRSILIDRDGHIIAGNKTAEGARAAGIKDVQVVQSDGSKLIAVQRTDLAIDDKAARELAIADNRASEVSLDWDLNVLADFEKDGLNFEQFWSPGELDRLLADVREPKAASEPQLDKAAELQQKYGTARGQIWEIGRHRLMCGDCTNRSDVGLLLSGAVPILIATDPPYGISLDMEWRDRAGLNIHGPAEPSYMKRNERYANKDKRYANKDMSGDTKIDWSDAFELAPSVLAIYVWHASRYTREVLYGLERIGFEHFQQIIWRKPIATRTRTHYWYQHEPCWYGRKKNAPWFGKGGTDDATVWDAVPPKFIFGGSDEEKIDHPTQKPLDLFKIPLVNHLEPDGLAYEPFSGSGTCLAAAESTRRTCYACEIDPRYVAVALQRMADMGLSPKLVKS